MGVSTVVILVFLLPIAAIDPVFGVIVAASVGAIGAYLAAAHRMSGKIGSTEAHDLWEESRSIRDWATARIDKCDEEIVQLRTELEAARERIRQLEEVLRERGIPLDF